MPILEIQGQRVTVGDDFLKLSPEQQQATVEEIATSLKPKAESKVSANDLVRATATGVPIVGGVLNKMNAATNAALAPVVEPFLEKGPETLDQPTFGERYSKSLDLQNKRDETFAAEHPVVDTVAKVAGGIGGTVPMVMAAPTTFGATGPLLQQMRNAAASGAALSGADAAVRGEDVVKNAAVGGGLGLVAPPIAKGIGAAVRAVRPAPAPVVQNTVDVAGTPVRMRPDQMTGDATAGARAEEILKGAHGERAQGVAQEFAGAQDAEIMKAADQIAAGLDKTGVGRVTPQDAGGRVVDELIAKEAARFTGEQNAAARAAAEETAARGAVAVDPASAAEVVSGGVAKARDAAVARTRDAYGRVREEPGTFDPQTVAGLSGDVRARLAAGDDPLTVNPQSTPQAHQALGVLDSLGGTGLFQNTAPRGPVGPVAEAAARAGAAPAGEDAVAALVAKGVNPERARAAVARMDEGTAAAPARTPFDEVREHTARIGARRDEVQRIIEDNGGKYRTISGKMVITPDFEKPGTLRLTYFDGKTPTGHVEGSARELAMEVARHETPRSVAGMVPHEVSTAGGQSVRVIPKVVEARSVKTSADPGYDPALQPRNRARAASDLQVNDIAKNLNPNRLGVSAEADRGAPIIGPDGLTESGNGRILGIRKAYEENGPAAQRYRDWLAGQGVDVSKFREPVLVRERATPMSPADRRAFTVAANQPATMSMGAAEKALADSRLLPSETLGLIRNPADLGSAENRDFVRAFMNGVPATERAALTTANGELSSEGLTRVRNAVLGKAYGDTPVLSRIAESASDDVKSISNGLVAAAPEWAQLRARIASGEVPAHMDVTGDLVDAVSRTARIRGKGANLADSHAQADAFGAQSAESKALQTLFYGADGKSAAPASQIGNALRHYAQEAGKVNAAPGLDLGLAPVTARDVLAATTAKAGAPVELAKEVAEAAAPAVTGPKIGDVGLKEMDAARKRLVTMFGDAKSTAIRTGDRSDLRAMSKVMHEFDQAILDAFENGRFSGDSAVAAQLLKDARASHAAYRQAFTSRGGGDDIGRSVEKILGRYSDTALAPDEVAKLSYGAFSDPGGGKAARVAQRLQTILGSSSPEWKAYKDGLLSYLLDAPAGATPFTAAQKAQRVEKFLDGAAGRQLSAVALTKGERDGLRSLATTYRASETTPVSSLNRVDKVIARISGRDGGIPMSPGEVADMIMSRNARTNKAMGVPLGQTLKRELSPESWDALRIGMFKRLTDAGEGRAQFGPQAMQRRISEFLDLDISKVYYRPEERAAMAQLAKAHGLMVPKPGTTNPSGSAWTAARLLNKASNNLGAMLGMVHGGLPGAAVGMGLEKGLRGISSVRNAREASRVFYGEQPRVAGRSSRVPIVLSQSLAPQVVNQ